METNDKKKTVFVGLSGGVDSSVAALRLLKEGYEVVGVFIKVWHPEFLECNWEEERLDAMRVAAHLGIPFLMCDAMEDYEKDVADYFIKEYQEGRTPNPDVMCNQYIKFGAFLRFAKEHSADYIATGHYARIKETNGKYELYKSADPNKDQTYFLWTLKQDQLSKTLFPVGDSTKEEIRREAEKAGLPTAIKKDSQGICFLGHVDIPEFLSHFTKLKPGSVLDESGQVIGEHGGALVYTLGQRHGFLVTTSSGETKPHYVVAKDLSKNTITVSTKKPILTDTQSLKLCSVNWTAGEPNIAKVQAAFRYRQAPVAAELKKISDREWLITPSEIIDKPAAGQSCVIYDKERCMGGGIITST